MDDELIERLLAHEGSVMEFSSRDHDVRMQSRRNPDGPAAVLRIEQQSARIKELEGFVTWVMGLPHYSGTMEAIEARVAKLREPRP